MSRFPDEAFVFFAKMNNALNKPYAKRYLLCMPDEEGAVARSLNER